MKESWRRWLRIFFIVVILFSVYKMAAYGWNSYRFNKEIDKIQLPRENITEEELENKESVDEKQLEKLRQQTRRIFSLHQEYEDLVAWISIPGTEVHFPVMHGKDNEFYLNHSYTGEYNPLGAVFIEVANHPDFSDDNTIIYGHNVRSGKIFHDVTQYMEEGFWQKAPHIVITTEKGIRTYEVFAAYVANPEDNFRSPYYEGEEKEVFLQRIQKGNLIPKEIPESIDQWITLQTCLDNNKRLVIHGKLTDHLQLPE